MPLKNGRTSAALQTIVVGSVIPPGTIQAFGGGTVPDGWLLCDGATVSRSTYSGLFTAIGTAHGSGNGTTSFHLPDLRGRFLRGADNMGTGAAGRDPDAAGRTAGNAGGNTGNAVGSVQSEAIKAHGHNYRITNNTGPNNGLAATSGQVGYNTSPQTFTVDSNSGNETRPQNLAVEYIIKV